MRRTEPTRHLYAGAPYTPSHASDIRERFKRIRAQQHTATVTTLPQRKGNAK
jgi:hypothetical protein